MIEIEFVSNFAELPDASVILVDENLKHSNVLDVAQNKLLNYMCAQDFKGKFSYWRSARLEAGEKLVYVAALGLGKTEELTEAKLQDIGGKIVAQSSCFKFIDNFSVYLEDCGEFSSIQAAVEVGYGAVLASYKFDKYKTKNKESEEQERKLKKIRILTSDVEKAKQLFESYMAVAKGIFFARDLISEPPNVLYPDSYAERVVNTLSSMGISVEVFGEAQMRTMGMHALLGVGQGSARESKMVMMRYNGTDEEAKPIVLVGKGVTFDTGGISLKPSAGMEDMKYDMAGSGAIVGAMIAAAGRKSKSHVIGLIGLVENMPGSNAQRPSDVVKSMQGKTIEVLDTDAEGRLVLADVLHYATTLEPKCIVDLATLTGAITIALGNTYAGLFSNDNTLAADLQAAGSKTDENLWRMPLHKDFEDMLKSEIADLANISRAARGAGSSSLAAHFLQHFVGQNKWAHLDIAGMAWEKRGKNTTPKGAVGFGVKLLNRFIEDQESK